MLRYKRLAFQTANFWMYILRLLATFYYPYKRQTIQFLTFLHVVRRLNAWRQNDKI